MRTSVACLIVLLALAGAREAAAVGPALWTVRQVAGAGGDVEYVAHAKRSGVTTIVARRAGRALRSVSLPGRWGFQVVTLAGDAAGLSANGRVLVASSPSADPAALAGASRFAVLHTAPLEVAQMFVLRGAFTVDALSPDGRTLFLIQHLRVGDDITRYRVRAYDLKTKRLLPRAIADRRQAGWTMRGFPIARVATADDRSVFTLYQPNGNYPFVHALDTVRRTAVCIGLPLSWTDRSLDGATLALRDAGKRLVVSGPNLAKPIAIDTTALRVIR
jgi:hypothetical protein